MNRTSAVGLILVGILACSAARAEHDEQKQLHRMERLQKELNLNEQQKQEFEKIFEETKPQLEALRKQGQELREKMHARLKAVLTPEQMEKFEKLHRERKELRKQGRPEHVN